MHTQNAGNSLSVVVTRIQFHPPKVPPLTSLDDVSAQGHCYCNSNAWGSHNCYQSGVIAITDQLILQNRKNLRGVQAEQRWAKI